MKRIYCLILLGMLVSNNLTSQSNWYHLTFPGSLSTVFFIDSLNGWVGGSGGIFKTTNGGANWISQTLPVTDAINRIIFLTQNVGFAVGSNGAVLKTSNGGTNWLLKRSGGVLQSITFFNGQYGWACGGDSVFSTTDQGETWFARSVTAIAHWDIAFRNDQEGWVVGLYGSCSKSTDGGGSWSSVSAPISGVSLFGVCFPSLSRGIIIGGSQIALSTNGGGSWTSVYNSGGEQLNSVTFADSLNGWVIGSSRILKTTNGGLTWYEQSWPPPTGYLMAVHSPDKMHAWIIGDGIVLKTSSGGGVTSVQSFSRVIPYDMNLYQNYPNPFNPTTIISYKLSHNSFVSLKVYDLLGREIQTLVYGFQNTGDHSVDFNGSNLSNGVYIYQLQTETFKSSKKLLLVK